MISTIITSSNYMHFNPFYNKKFPGCLTTCPWTSWWRNPCFSILAKPCTLNSHPLRLSYSVPLVCNVRRRQTNVASDSRSWTYVNCGCWQLRLNEGFRHRAIITCLQCWNNIAGTPRWGGYYGTMIDTTAKYAHCKVIFLLFHLNLCAQGAAPKLRHLCRSNLAR